MDQESVISLKMYIYNWKRSKSSLRLEKELEKYQERIRRVIVFRYIQYRRLASVGIQLTYIKL
jgi:hypothetical protein